MIFVENFIGFTNEIQAQRLALGKPYSMQFHPLAGFVVEGLFVAGPFPIIVVVIMTPI